MLIFQEFIVIISYSLKVHCKKFLIEIFENLDQKFPVSWII